MKRVTQQHIADALGISRITVTKALGGNPSVSAELRKIVLEKAAELGYGRLPEAKPVPDGVASLFTFEGGDSGSYWGQVIDGMVKGLAAHGIDLGICFVGAGDDGGLQTPANFRPGQSRGVITLGKFTSRQMGQVCALGLPVVAVDTFVEQVGHALLCDTIMVANRRPVEDITRTLARQGHKAIGYVGETGTCLSFWERWQGYRKGLEAEGVPFRQELCFAPENLEDEAFQGMARREALPTAFVCANDNAAMQLLLWLRHYGREGKTAVSGFDNTLEAQLLGLTTVENHKEYLGERAAEQLCYRIRSPQRPYEMVRVESWAVYRESTREALAR